MDAEQAGVVAGTGLLSMGLGHGIHEMLETAAVPWEPAVLTHCGLVHRPLYRDTQQTKRKSS